VKTSKSASARRIPPKVGSGGVPPAAPAGIAVPPKPRWNRALPAVRPPSIIRFPGLLNPQDSIRIGGNAL